MPVSDDLSKLSVRAKEAEGRVTAAPEKAKADLEEDLEFTRTAVEKQNAVLREQNAVGCPAALTSGVLSVRLRID